jgi:hypothetical protein
MQFVGIVLFSIAAAVFYGLAQGQIVLPGIKEALEGQENK